MMKEMLMTDLLVMINEKEIVRQTDKWTETERHKEKGRGRNRQIE